MSSDTYCNHLKEAINKFDDKNDVDNKELKIL
jgi:hypothetical protein